MAHGYDDVLVAIRKIIRATDLYSQKLRKSVGLTTPQLLVLRAVGPRRDVSLGKIANDLSLSQATVTSLVDRLESRGLVTRRRSKEDKRRIHVELTQKGRDVLDRAPNLLQDDFVVRFDALPEWERSMITAALQRAAALMNAQDLDASPVLATGDIAPSPVPKSAPR